MYGSSNGIDLILPSVDHRIGSKHELKQRIMEFIDDLNRDPVVAFSSCSPPSRSMPAISVTVPWRLYS